MTNGIKYDYCSLSSHCKILLCTNDMNFELMFLNIKSKQTETTLQAQLSRWLPRASLFISLPLITPWSHLPLSYGPCANAPQQVSSYFQLLYDDGSKTCFCHSFKCNLKINKWEADLHFHLLAPLTWVFLPLKTFWIHSPCSESHQEVKILIVTCKLNSKTWLHYSGDKRARDYWHFSPHLNSWGFLGLIQYKHMWVQGNYVLNVFICFGHF